MTKQDHIDTDGETAPQATHRELVVVLAVMDALSRAREFGRVIVLVGPGGERIACRLRKPLRAPHHTAHADNMLGEVALAAGGTLYLDGADRFQKRTLRRLGSLWGQMDGNPARPELIVSVEDEAGAKRVIGVLGDVGVRRYERLDLV